MKKKVLLDFIDKYNLGGLVDKVKWRVDSNAKTMWVRGEINSKTFVVNLTLKNFEELKEDLILCIFDTNKVRSMLSPFQGQDIALSVEKTNDRLTALVVSDPDCESHMSLAEANAIAPVSGNISSAANYEVEVNLTEEFVSSFLSAYSALREVQEFTVKMNKNDKLEFVLGHSGTSNTNRINILAPTVAGKDKIAGTVKFPIENFVQILKANSEITDGILSIFSRGVIKIEYKTEQFDALYMQFATIKK